MLPPQQRPVAPETFLLDQDAQQSLPADSVVALQQVDNRMCHQPSPSSSSLIGSVANILYSKILSHLCSR
jgi:hypothetical protein